MDDGSPGAPQWRRWLISITVGACCLVILAEILRSDGGFRAAYPDGPWRHLATHWHHTAARDVALLLAAVARAVLRVPLVQLRVLADHPAAIAPVLGAMTFMGAALLADAKPESRFASKRLLDLAGLLLGVAAILWLLPLGPGEWGVGSDWEKDWVYYSAIQQAVVHHEMPYYLRTSFQGTERYLSNLETPSGPHVVLLRVIDPGSFFLVQVSACLSLGYIALLKLRHELALSRFWWAMFVVLFVLNGNLVSHLGSGHTQWAGYFLLPWIWLGIVRATSNTQPPNAVMLALPLSAMIWIGGWHIFVWSYLLLLAFGMSGRERLLFVVRVSAMVAALSAFRLLPAVATFGGGSNEFAVSYQSMSQFMAALIGGPLPGPQLHEYDAFVGWLGFAVAGIGAISYTIRNRQAAALWIPSVVLIVLSAFDIYKHTLFKLPGFVSERVVTRMAIVGVLGLALIGCARLSETAARRSARSTVRAIALASAAGFLAVQLALHAESRRAATGARIPLEDVLKRIAIEPLYYWSVWIGAAVSATALAVIVLAAGRHWRHWRRSRPNNDAEAHTPSVTVTGAM